MSTAAPSRTVGVVTTSRADFGIYRPVLDAIVAHPALELRLYVSGTHLSQRFGHTVDAIIAAGFEVSARVPCLSDDDGDAPQDIATATGLAVQGFGAVFAEQRPDMLVVLGDRFEMAASALAAVPFAIPMAHIHGGETSQGAIDEALRHSITKMAHLHFVATERYGRRVGQLGEEPWRVTVSGAPGLDAIAQMERATVEEIEAFVGISLATPPILVTLHPTTLAYRDTAAHTSLFLEGLEAAAGERPIVFTYPNADTAGRLIIEAIDTFVAQRPAHRAAVPSLGSKRYFGMLGHAAVMVGNSSSGIIEAASFGLPVVNVGDRQRGRDHGPNVLQVPLTSAKAVTETIVEAITPSFREHIAGLENPYGDGTAAPKIVARLAEIPLGSAGLERLLLKRFHDIV